MKYIKTEKKEGYITKIEDLTDYIEYDLYETIEELVKRDDAINNELELMTQDRDWWERKSDNYNSAIVDTVDKLSNIKNELQSGKRINKKNLINKLASITDELLNYY